ncbi:MAG TPA: 50S ribosomal protein L11 methyltransferase [Micropepsaceae bacterium]|nr:50S ribosomal protein L11 methyltransferase [Micropepsaceae bacterium]
MTSPPLWKASVTVPKEMAPDVAAVFELTPPLPQSVLIGENPFETDAAVEALYDTRPNADLLSRVCGRDVRCEPLPDQDWIRLSLEGLPPVRAGRFFLHGAHDAGVVPPGVIPLRIEAGLAFGTGHHESTALCLEALCRLGKARAFIRVLDVGCGTGVLAIAAAKLWHGTVVASDIDPVATEITRANAKENGAGPEIHCACADGLDHPQIRASAPYDLICANILARPLTRLAPAIAKAARPGGTVLLSGLLRNQEKLVLSFYQAQKLVFYRAFRSGPWSALVLRKA